MLTYHELLSPENTQLLLLLLFLAPTKQSSIWTKTILMDIYFKKLPMEVPSELRSEG